MPSHGSCRHWCVLSIECKTGRQNGCHCHLPSIFMCFLDRPWVGFPDYIIPYSWRVPCLKGFAGIKCAVLLKSEVLIVGSLHSDLSFNLPAVEMESRNESGFISQSREQSVPDPRRPLIPCCSHTKMGCRCRPIFICDDFHTYHNGFMGLFIYHYHCFINSEILWIFFFCFFFCQL